MNEAVVASIIGDWTGIPVGKMVKDDVAVMQNLDKLLQQKVRGQDRALDLVARELRAAKSGLKSPQTPLGVFLFVGPSGVGKTESAIAIADLPLRRRALHVHHQHERVPGAAHRLQSSARPPATSATAGGILSEAVRQRPYSVVLLDEVEKADKDVLNMFYQVFDRARSPTARVIIDFRTRS